LLQIENEFYGTIRPKRVIRPGERPLHALRERGVEYVEVRCMDLNPFVDIGIDESTVRLLDVFLLHCHLSDSPPDTPAEIAELAHNQQTVAAAGRAPGAMLRQQGRERPLLAWASELLQQCTVIAETLDAWEGSDAYSQALRAAQAGVQAPHSLPSAQVVQRLTQGAGQSHVDLSLAFSAQARGALLAQPWPAAQASHFEALATASRQAQAAIEAADTLPFELFRQEYVSPQRLGL